MPICAAAATMMRSAATSERSRLFPDTLTPLLRGVHSTRTSASSFLSQPRPRFLLFHVFILTRPNARGDFDKAIADLTAAHAAAPDHPNGSRYLEITLIRRAGVRERAGRVRVLISADASSTTPLQTTPRWWTSVARVQLMRGMPSLRFGSSSALLCSFQTTLRARAAASQGAQAAARATFGGGGSGHR